VRDVTITVQLRGDPAEHATGTRNCWIHRKPGLMDRPPKTPW